jgi:hypothetical protein
VTEHTDELARRIDTIERGYEFLLAFAAQGRRDDSGTEVRATLVAIHAALSGLADLVAARVATAPPQTAGSEATFVDIIADDARKARGAIGFVLAVPSISSLLVDNLNASIHVRALLTDLFLADQALRPT